MNKLMILSEDEDYQAFHYRISCQCTEPNCHIDLDIMADTIEIEGKEQICGWSLEFWQQFQGWRSFWQRVKTGLSLIFYKNRWMTNAFVLDDDNVHAFEYTLKKYWEVNKKYHWNAYQKFIDSHLKFGRLYHLALNSDKISESDRKHLDDCKLCMTIYVAMQQENLS
jgi:hypothetical protein